MQCKCMSMSPSCLLCSLWQRFPNNRHSVICAFFTPNRHVYD